VTAATLFPDRLTIRPLTAADAEQVRRWRYDGPWSVYDSRPDDPPITSADGYHTIADAADGTFLGYVCVGTEARVPGLAEDPALLDVGVGMRPDLVGQGHGQRFGAAALAYADRLAGGRPLRAVVQTWNRRSLRLTERLGFVEAGQHMAMQGGKRVEYVVLVRQPAADRTRS